MFNEAFWFFYWVNVVVAMQIVFILSTILIGGAGVMMTIASYVEDLPEMRPWGFRLLAAGALSLILSVAIPPKEAFYAGAGQYVVQAAEVDQTLIQLKELIDKKIAEEAEK